MVFGVYLRFDMPYYALYLVSGLFLWQSFSNIIFAGLNCFFSNAQLIKKLPCRRCIFVWSVVFAELIHLFLTIPIILWVMFYVKLPLTCHFLIIIPVTVMFCLFMAGWVFLLGSLQLLLRDIERILIIVIQLMFYLTPVFYPAHIVPDKFSFLLKLNPVYAFIQGWRYAFSLPSTSLPINILGECLLWTVIFLTCGVVFYSLKHKKFAEVI